MHCCGVEGYKDWEKILNKTNTVTGGCCKPNTDAKTCFKDIPEDPSPVIYTDGCFDVFIGWVEGLGIGLGVISIILGLIQV